jgi:hypothetical protein
MLTKVLLENIMVNGALQRSILHQISDYAWSLDNYGLWFHLLNFGLL